MTRVKTLLVVLAVAVAATGIGFAVGQSQTEEVRVVARSLADGRIEFGIEHDGERVLPTGRYMNTSQIGARNDKWLRSTPVQISVPERVLLEPDPFEPTRVSPSGSGDLWWGTYDRDAQGMSSDVDLRGTTDNNDYPVAWLKMWCWHDDPSGTIHFNIHAQTDFSYVDNLNATLIEGAEAQFGGLFDGGQRQSYGLVLAETRSSVYYTGSAEFLRQARSNRWLTVWLKRPLGETIRATFDLSQGFFNTPVQSNIDRCGD